MIKKAELCLALFAITAWIVLFAGGILISTDQYKANINSETGLEYFKSWVFIILFYTITNAAILSCLSAVIGAIARRTTESHTNNLVKYYLAAILEGFFIYLVLISGLILLTTQAITEASQSQYIRIGGTLSLVSFVVAYDKTMFSFILNKIKAVTKGGNDEIK